MTKLSPKLAAKIATRLTNGETIRDAAKAEGVPAPTAYAWVRRGRSAPPGPKKTIADAYDLAKGRTTDGAKPNQPAVELPPGAAPETRRSFLERQICELRRYADQAESSGIIGPLPALKKQEREAFDDLATIRERDADPLLGLSDDDLVYSIQEAIVSLPVRLRDQLAGTFDSLTSRNVVKIGEATTA